MSDDKPNRPERKLEQPDYEPEIEGGGGCCEVWESLSTKREEEREE